MKPIAACLVGLLLVGCASPSFKLSMGLYRKTTPETISAEQIQAQMEKLSLPVNINLTPELVKAFLPEKDKVEVLFCDVEAYSQQVESGATQIPLIPKSEEK